MTQLATPDAVRGDFDNVVARGTKRMHHLERTGDAYFVDGQPVVMTTGSHHMQSYWVSRNQGRVVELVQLSYLFDEERWVPYDSIFLQPPGTRQRTDLWNDSCIECHATHGRPRLSSDVDTHVTEFGIACEACHGPAREHAESQRSPWRRYGVHLDEGSTDPTIVNPERLSPRLASHVCARCHGLTVFTSPALADDYYDGVGDRFRPGDDLELTSHILLGPGDPLEPSAPSPAIQAYRRDSRFWPDGPSRGSGREFNAMVFSPCFGDGTRDDQVSCLSCHQMHQQPNDRRSLRRWADDQLKSGMDGDLACMQCHEKTMGPDISTHTGHKVGSAGSRCYNCHMPFTTYGLLKAIRSHYILNPAVGSSLSTGRPNACNLCHLDKSLGWTAKYLEKWYETPPPKLTAEQRNVAASLLWMLGGDARQRVLLAWHAGWKPARQASGEDWIAPFLAPLLSDPYSVVRIVSGRSIRELPGFESFPVDYLGDEAELRDATRRAWRLWQDRGSERQDAAIMLGPEGIDWPALQALLERRDDRPVGVTE